MKLKTTASIPILLIIVFVLLFAANNYLSPALSGTNGYVAFLIIELSVYFVPSLIYIIKRKKGFIRELSFNLIRAKHISVILASSLFIVFSGALYSVILYKFGITKPMGYTEISGAVSDNFLISIIFLVALPAFFEELLFRGIVLREYSKYGKFVSVLFSAVCFAIFHFSLENFIYYFLSGIVLAATAYITNSILASFAVHLINNLVTVFCERYLLNMFHNFGEISFVILVLTIFTLLSLFCLLTVLDKYYYKLAHTKRHEETIKKQNALQALSEVFISPYFLILALLFIAVALDIII